MKRRTFTRLFGLSALLLLVGLAGCNTTAGMGEDMQDAGEAIEDEAE